MTGVEENENRVTVQASSPESAPPADSDPKLKDVVKGPDRVTHPRSLYPNIVQAFFCESCRIPFQSLAQIRFHNKSVHKPIRIQKRYSPTSWLTSTAAPKKKQKSSSPEDEKGMFVDGDHDFHDNIENVDPEEEVVEGYSCQVCDICKAVFVSRIGFVKHMLHNHDHFECIECGHFLPRNEYLPHLILHAEQDYDFTLGNVNRRSLYPIKDDRSKNPDAIIRCEHCKDQIFTMDSTYAAHMKSVHGNLHENTKNQPEGKKEKKTPAKPKKQISPKNKVTDLQEPKRELRKRNS